MLVPNEVDDLEIIDKCMEDLLSEELEELRNSKAKFVHFDVLARVDGYIAFMTFGNHRSEFSHIKDLSECNFILNVSTAVELAKDLKGLGKI